MSFEVLIQADEYVLCFRILFKQNQETVIF